MNGAAAGVGKDSHLASEFEVTDLLHPGANTIRLTVVKWSDASYVEDQDQWWHGGITRPVTLYATEPTFLADLRVEAEWARGNSRLLDTAAGKAVQVDTAALPAGEPRSLRGDIYATRERVNAKGEGMSFTNVSEVSRAYESRQVDLHAKCWVRIREVEIGADGEKSARWMAKARALAAAGRDDAAGNALEGRLVERGQPRRHVAVVVGVDGLDPRIQTRRLVVGLRVWMAGSS